MNMESILQYVMVGFLSVVAFFLKQLYAQIKEDADRIRKLEIEVQKQSTENLSLFKRMDEIRDKIKTLCDKIDRMSEK